MNYPDRPVAGFFRKEDLECLLFLQQNDQPLSTVPIKEIIVNRSYQVEGTRQISVLRNIVEWDNFLKAQ